MGVARFVWFLTLSLAVALATWAFGWGAVVVCSAAWTWIRRSDAAAPLLAAVAAALAWGGLLLVQSFSGPVGGVAEVVGEAMQVGAAPLVMLTLAFPALLAGAAAGLVRGIPGGDVR
jgi:hypothetical protein